MPEEIPGLKRASKMNNFEIGEGTSNTEIPDPPIEIIGIINDPEEGEFEREDAKETTLNGVGAPLSNGLPEGLLKEIELHKVSDRDDLTHEALSGSDANDQGYLYDQPTMAGTDEEHPIVMQNGLERNNYYIEESSDNPAMDDNLMVEQGNEDVNSVMQHNTRESVLNSAEVLHEHARDPDVPIASEETGYINEELSPDNEGTGFEQSWSNYVPPDDSIGQEVDHENTAVLITSEETVEEAGYITEESSDNDRPASGSHLPSSVPVDVSTEHSMGREVDYDNTRATGYITEEHFGAGVEVHHGQNEPAVAWQVPGSYADFVIAQNAAPQSMSDRHVQEEACSSRKAFVDPEDPEYWFKLKSRINMDLYFAFACFSFLSNIIIGWIALCLVRKYIV